MFSAWSDRLRRAFGFRLAWWYALVFTAGAVALVGVTYLLLALTLRQHDREIIETTLVQLASAYTRGGVDALTREIQRTQASGASGPLLVRTLGRRQNVIYLSVPEDWGQFDLSQLAEPPLTGEQRWATVEASVDNQVVLEVASVRLPDGTLFQVGKSTERREELLRRFRWVLLINLAFIMFIGLAGGAVLTRSALHPVRALAGTVRGILRTGRTNARVPIEEPGDTLGDLAVLVNAMLDRIDAVVSGMRGALDNVAHDLRTPMTRLRGIAETALASNDPAVLREAVADILEETEVIVAMLNTLMDISEAETGTMALRVEPVDMRTLIDQTVDLYEDVAEERGIRIETRIPEDLVVEVDRVRMRQALANLVDNAVKYTGSGGSVEITADAPAAGGYVGPTFRSGATDSAVGPTFRSGAADSVVGPASTPGAESEIVISVSDTGPGIPDDELNRVWERLYRGDKSRSTRGLGLGLSLVKAIVEAHGGHVSVTSRVGAGSRFEVRLPRRANMTEV